MRKCYLLLTAVLFFAFTAHADHISGGEIRYAYAGGTNYRIELDLYTQCTGTALPTTASVLVASFNCSFSQNLALSLYRIDTLKDISCSSAVGLCSSGAPLYLIHHYRNTISLTCPATDWKFSYTSCCRTLGIQNIDLMSSSNIYLEAGMNNKIAPNSSAFIDNPPPFVTGSGAMISTPIHATDLEGDSIVHAVIPPQTSMVTNVLYNTGFSASDPLGTGVPVTVTTTPEVLKTYSNAGRSALAIRTYDYRAGIPMVFMGYSSRYWDNRAGGVGNPKAPLPTSATSFNATICPGGTTTINLSFMDSVGTDSVFADCLDAVPVVFPGFTSTVTKSPGIGSGSVQFSFVAPATLSAATNPYFIIPIFVRDNACPVRGYAIYNVVLRVSPCVADTVWPGDANGDKVVNLYDPLAVSVAYGKTGPPRPSASLAWTPQPCSNWSSSFLNSVNMKHADCNGDGTVNNSDLAAITANYGLTHPRELYLPHAKIAGLPDLYFDLTGVYAYPGATVNIPIKIGTAASSISNLYGVAASLRIAGITPGLSSAPLSYSSSWLGTAANTVQFSKTTTTNNVDWAYARNNHQAISGNGKLAELSFTIPTSVPVGQKITLMFKNVKIIDANGNELSGYNILSDTLTIAPMEVGKAVGQFREAVILPNPSNGPASLKVTLDKATDVHIGMTDVAGRTVATHKTSLANGSQVVELPTESLPTGMYLIHIRVDNASPETVLKWVKY